MTITNIQHKPQHTIRIFERNRLTTKRRVEIQVRMFIKTQVGNNTGNPVVPQGLPIPQPQRSRTRFRGLGSGVGIYHGVHLGVAGGQHPQSSGAGKMPTSSVCTPESLQNCSARCLCRRLGGLPPLSGRYPHKHANRARRAIRAMCTVVAQVPGYSPLRSMACASSCLGMSFTIADVVAVIVLAALQ